MSLVSFDAALAQLREIPGANDAEVARKLEEAEDWAREIMGANYDPEWTEETLPGRVRSAILLYLTAVYDGDPDGKNLDVANRLIERSRDHTLA